MSTVTLYNGEPVTAGDDLQLNLTLNTDGAATNVTGWTCTATFYQNGKKVIADHAVSLTTAASGIVRVSITAAENTFAAGEVTFDIKGVSGGGTVRHFGPGRFTVRRSLT